MKHVFFVLVFFALFVEPAYCYLDPGTGSMLAQLIMGGVAGVLVVFKLYWKKVKSFFIKTNSNPERDDTSQKE
ncbi:MAG: hypothetical protein H8E42_08155 [Nitrospinae bacterium]|nr:hypothetical protein [Nitrospinota bacterium]MBL7019147.1 hypothetical protein [Nitrospinaceae bacterium]